MDKELLIPFRTEKGRFDHPQNVQTYLATVLNNSIDHLPVERRFPDHPSFSHLSLAHLKLGLDQAYNGTSVFQERNKPEKKFLNGDKGRIDDDEIDLLFYLFS